MTAYLGASSGLGLPFVDQPIMVDYRVAAQDVFVSSTRRAAVLS